jgi:hypothetical protein
MRLLFGGDNRRAGKRAPQKMAPTSRGHPSCIPMLFNTSRVVEMVRRVVVVVMMVVVVLVHVPVHVLMVMHLMVHRRMVCSFFCHRLVLGDCGRGRR